MKWLNVGTAEGFDKTQCAKTLVNASYTNTGHRIDTTDSNGRIYLEKSFDETKEVWVSFDVYRDRAFSTTGRYVVFGFVTKATRSNTPLIICATADTSSDFKVATITSEYDFDNGVVDSNRVKILYDPQKNVNMMNGIHNIEIHMKCGEEGRIDMWIDTKLFFSFRSPSLFPETVSRFIMKTDTLQYWSPSSFILQDTRRIGLEKFKKLIIDPATEQNMPQGSTTTYKLSGLSDATEYSDITSVCAVLQATSRDTNITAGTFSLDGNEIGTIDVSDSSGRAYEIAHSETNSTTGKSWTAADIEGKTLSFKVNGAE